MTAYEVSPVREMRIARRRALRFGHSLRRFRNPGRRDERYSPLCWVAECARCGRTAMVYYPQDWSEMGRLIPIDLTSQKRGYALIGGIATQYECRGSKS